MFLGKKNAADIVDEACAAFPDEEIVGLYQFWMPIFILKNPDLTERILIKDFSYFCDRSKPLGNEKSPENSSLFSLNGNTWRAVRYKFTPLFTSGKLKYMFNSIKDCGKTLTEVMKKNEEKEVDVSEIMCLFAMDVIGSCAFGMDISGLQNPDCEFRKKGRDLFFLTTIGNIKMLMLFMSPTLSRLLGIKGFFRQDLVKYFCGIITDSLEHRKKAGFERNDFVQMLLQLKEKGKIEIKVHDKQDDYLLMDKLGKTEDTFELELTDNILVGGAFGFLTAGFHASAMTLTFALYELARNPHVTQRLRQEIKEKLDVDNITYDDLKNMTYLEKIIKETLRLYPSVRFLTRICTKEYTLPNGQKILPEQIVFIPVSYIQRDPAHFPEPLVFNPDRFDTPPRFGTYLPFGEGPRVCIAMRFALLEMKFALANLLANFDFKVKEGSPPVELHPRTFLTTPKNGVKLLITKIGRS